MKTLLYGAVVLLLYASSTAQTAASPAGGFQAFTVSADPSAQELTSLFTETGEGLHDPFMVLRKIGSMGDAVVPALQTFLFNTPILRVGVLDPDGKTVDSVNAPAPNKQYGIMALDLIGTPLAYQALATVAQSDSDAQVRGMAVRSLAIGYFYRAKQDSLVPDKAVVGILLQNLDDTTYVNECGRTIAQIARRGLINWTGTDYGEAPPDSVRVQERQRLDMTITQYRQQWFKNNSAKIVWDPSTDHFVVK